MTRRHDLPPEPPSAPGAAGPKVQLTKRSAAPVPEESAPREKICAECGIRFRLEPGKKFYLCPDCYRRAMARRPHGDRGATRILTHITCARCGSQEYVPFVPEDPSKALCRACFAAERTEPGRSPRRPPHR